MYRTHTCGELSLIDLDKTVLLSGWLENTRDFGSIVFFVIRDFYGITQSLSTDICTMKKIREISKESTIQIKGIVRRRSDPNHLIPTGDIEIEVEEITALGKCMEILPFQIGNSIASREDTRLKYRFLDLRNPINKNKIILRAEVINFLRNKMIDLGFIEIQTPILTSSSPEGARDFLVPSRVHPGKFYALPQAPQQFKQLLMVSGFDKYFQIAPCFRDEDSRADRSPGEFYQLDIEMSFAEQEDVFKVVEEVISELFAKFTKTYVASKFLRIKYSDAMSKYCTDKPDLRNPLVIEDATSIFGDIDIPFFKNKTIKSIKVSNFNKSRKLIDELSVEVKKMEGDGISWLKLDENRDFSGSFSKYINVKYKDLIINNFALEPKDAVFFIADTNSIATKLAGFLRQKLGEVLELIDAEAFKFCWVVDFPMYEKDENNAIIFSHNPFSMPQGGLEALNTKLPLDIFAYQYDLVCNGIELSSGAVRNHDTEIMIKAFEIAGYSEQTICEKFPALYNAFKYGAPPHAGIAPGVDRMVMLLAKENSIREVIAFPMNKNAQDLLMNAPSTVTQKQLEELSIIINEKNKL